MSIAPAEYVRDVKYPRQYARTIAPPMLRLVAALNGIAPPPEESFDYCDLGCGTGDTLVLLAAANPRARFVGVDFNHEHIEAATSLAKRGEIENVRLLEASFADLEAEELPELDFIVAHGILSWVDVDVQNEVLAFVAKRLKPGGLFFASYDAMPGWSAVHPLRRLMLEHTADVSGSTLARAKEGVAFAQRFADAGARYFADNPTAKSMLGLVRGNAPEYVAHEYFNRELRPLYFSDVARATAAVGLSYVGQIPLYANVPELSTPPSARKLIEGTTDRVRIETLKDFANNELFRSDVFVKGSPGRSEGVMRAYFDRTPFGSLSAPGLVKREVKLPLVTLEFTGPVYDAILSQVTRAPASAVELAERRECAGLPASRIGDCFRNLALGSQLVPMPAWPAPPAPAAFNETAMREALYEGGPCVVASTATGAGVQLSHMEMLALYMHRHVAAEAQRGWISKYFGEATPSMEVAGKKLRTVAELEKALVPELRKIDALLPKLVDLGVLAP